MLEKLREQYREAALRLAALKEERDRRLAEWEAQNRQLLEDLEHAKAEVEEAEAALRAAALKAFEETGEKKVATGIGVRVYRVPRYDEAQALAWAVERRMAEVLKLDRRRFDKIATDLHLDFVEVEEVAKATISKEVLE